MRHISKLITSEDESERLVGDDRQEGVDVDAEEAAGGRHDGERAEVDVIHLRVVAVRFEPPLVVDAVAAEAVQT